MKKLILTILFFVLLSFSVNAGVLSLYQSECNDKGSLKLTFTITEADYKVEANSLNLEVGGIKYTDAWSNTRYLKKGEDSSKENTLATYNESTFNGNKIYNGKLTYIQTALTGSTKGEPETKTLDFSVNCPGLKFTCAQLGLSIDSCINTPNGFEAIITMKGMEQSPGYELDPVKAITYRFSAESAYLQATGANTKDGMLPKDYTIEKISQDIYKLSFNIGENKIKEMHVYYDEFGMKASCLEDDYPEVDFYSSQDCTVGESVEDSCICAEIYKPVCGEDGKTYPNECNAKCENVKITHEGECTKKDSAKEFPLMWIILIVIIILGTVIAISLKKKKSKK
ncbi:MAG: Kazal-type serine protease inhibitor family protein [Candidatus Nanoarchaeia archaeon]|nr:Kazal-type serine protease inhibitor family protein [Candidatus Nanoarchaeia archaeon]